MRIISPYQLTSLLDSILSSLPSIERVCLVPSKLKVYKKFTQKYVPNNSHAVPDDLGASEDIRTNNPLRDLVTHRGQLHGPEDDNQALHRNTRLQTF